MFTAEHTMALDHWQTNQNKCPRYRDNPGLVTGFVL